MRRRCVDLALSGCAGTAAPASWRRVVTRPVSARSYALGMAVAEQLASRSPAHNRARRGRRCPRNLCRVAMDPRYLRTLRALTVGGWLAACERRPDPFEPPSPLVTPGASLLDASTASAPVVPARVATPVVVPVAPARTPQEIADAYKRDLIARGCPETLPSGPCPSRVTVACTYDVVTRGIRSNGGQTCYCAGIWNCQSPFAAVPGPLPPPRLDG